MAMMVSVHIPVMAEDNTYGDLSYILDWGDVITITDCDPSAVNVDIPAEIDGKRVYKIGDSAFRDCTALESVTMDARLDVIDDNAFRNCTSLTSVTAPGITHIGINSFNGCTSLPWFDLPETLTYINVGAFRDCANLTGIVLPKDVTVIPHC